MYRFIFALAMVVMLIGLAIIGYGAYVALVPASMCQPGGTGCGAPPASPKT